MQAHCAQPGSLRELGSATMIQEECAKSLAVDPCLISFIYTGALPSQFASRPHVLIPFLPLDSRRWRGQQETWWWMEAVMTRFVEGNSGDQESEMLKDGLLGVGGHYNREIDCISISVATA